MGEEEKVNQDHVSQVGEDNFIYVDNKPGLKINVPSPQHSMTFHDFEGNEVGWLDFMDGTMKFSGNMEESAKGFFEYLKALVDFYLKTKNL